MKKYIKYIDNCGALPEFVTYYLNIEKHQQQMKENTNKIIVK